MIEVLNASQPNYCYCTLALRRKYCLFAKELAADLKLHSPRTTLVVGTDYPEEFCNCENVLVFEHHQTHFLNCYNDKRFVIAKALSLFESAIFIDADTRIKSHLPASIVGTPGLSVLYFLNLRENMQSHILPKDFLIYQNLSKDLGIELDEYNVVPDSLYMVTRDRGREQIFIKCWGLIAEYLEFKGCKSTNDGYIMSIAAALSNFPFVLNENELSTILRAREHLGDTPKFQGNKGILDRISGRFNFVANVLKAKASFLKLVG